MVGMHTCLEQPTQKKKDLTSCWTNVSVWVVLLKTESKRVVLLSFFEDSSCAWQLALCHINSSMVGKGDTEHWWVEAWDLWKERSDGAHSERCDEVLQKWYKTAIEKDLRGIWRAEFKREIDWREVWLGHHWFQSLQEGWAGNVGNAELKNTE